jgi:uncharacterized protein
VSLRLPLFPLGTVLCPGCALPLHVFEDRYRRLVEDLLAGPKDAREFGVLTIRRGFEVGEGAALDYFDTGCTAVVDDVTTYEDGRYDLVTHGHRRFTLAQVEPAGPYLMATVDFLDEPVGDDPEGAESVARIVFARYQHVLIQLRDLRVVVGDLPEDPVQLSYVLSSAVVAPTPVRQRLLEIPDATARLLAVADLMRAELAAMRAVPSLPATEVTRFGYSPN